jgi:hypothetical protein
MLARDFSNQNDRRQHDVLIKLEVFDHADSVASYPLGICVWREIGRSAAQTERLGEACGVFSSGSRGFAVLQLINVLTEWGSRYASRCRSQKLFAAARTDLIPLLFRFKPGKSRAVLTSRAALNTYWVT